MTEEQANSIYDILVELGGASERMRDAFIYAHHTKKDCDEWRFQGKFGFGGKFWSKYLDVNYYSEHETDELNELKQTINNKISDAMYGGNIGKTLIVGDGTANKTVKGVERHPVMRRPYYIVEEDLYYHDPKLCKIVED